MLQSDLTSRTDTGADGLPPFPRLLLSGGIAFVACLVAKLISVGPVSLPLIWPCAGVAFTFAWRNGLRWAVPPAVGGALWAWVEFGAIGPILVIFAASVAGPALAVAALRRLNNWKPAEYRLEAAVRFVGVVVLLAAPTDALLATVGLEWSGLLAAAHPAHRFMVWWLLDALGILLVARRCSPGWATRSPRPNPACRSGRWSMRRRSSSHCW